MNKRQFCGALLLVGLSTNSGWSTTSPLQLITQAAQAASSTKADYKISGPFVSGNLSIFLIRGQDQQKGQTYLTLQEGLAQKKVVVHETGDVNKLSIDNLSNSVVFIQSGDIVKGGQQDRAMQSDLLIAPHTKNMALPAFCVEHDRWTGRGSESASKFASASSSLASKPMKMAAKVSQDQGMVWASVAQYQQKLEHNVQGRLSPSPSPSSLELTLEDKHVQASTAQMVKDLSKLPDQEANVIGYAFAINGTVNSADVYASNGLFRKMWPKLLQSSAVEAVAERGGKTKKPATEADIRECFSDAARGKAVPGKSQSTPSMKSTMNESKQDILFVTRDKRTNVVVHSNYLTK